MRSSASALVLIPSPEPSVVVQTRRLSSLDVIPIGQGSLFRCAGKTGDDMPNQGCLCCCDGALSNHNIPMQTSFDALCTVSAPPSSAHLLCSLSSPLLP